MNAKNKKFVDGVWAHYAEQGRNDLPWRKTINPYRILVSEVMLQQTQVDRVIPKYKAFLKQFPSLKKLSTASLGDVLRAWQGLGYNRRAKMLHLCAQAIMLDHKGHFPQIHAELMKLPGIGHYTAGAIMAFAYNQPVPIIETNIRSVFLYHFFNNQTDVHDQDILKCVTETLDTKDSKTWYAALMDYGTYIKKTKGNPNSQSKHYTVQSAFKGSDRQIRGAILKLLLDAGKTRTVLHKQLPFDVVRIDAQLENLLKESLIAQKGLTYSLPK